MTESSFPFGNSKDPFVPEVVRVELPGGTSSIDIWATALNHSEAHLPEINSSNLRPRDILAIDFDDEHKETFEVVSLHPDSLVFGSDDVTHPTIVLKQHADDERGSTEVEFHGSAVSPWGTMTKLNTIRVGSYLVTNLGVSTGAIRNFDLRRADYNGDLRPVRLNQQERAVQSESFSKAKNAFDEFESLLEADGFKFGDVEGLDKSCEVLENGRVILTGSPARYKKVEGDRLIHAVRQGFGSAVIPQDEVWIYDAKAEILRAMRNVPGQGIFQMAVAEGVTKRIFQEVGNWYRKESNSEWREQSINSTHIRLLADHVPITSYTWLSPDQKTPVITILESEKNLGSESIFRIPREKPSISPEITESLGLDLNETRQYFKKVQVDIYPGEGPKLRETSPYFWPTQELADDFVRNAQDSINIAYKKNGAVLTIEKHKIHISTDTGQEIEKMTKAARLTFGITQKTIGFRLLNWTYSKLPQK